MPHITFRDSKRFNQEVRWEDGYTGNQDQFMKEIIYRAGINLGCYQIQIKNACKYNMIYDFRARIPPGFFGREVVAEFSCSMGFTEFTIGFELVKCPVSEQDILGAIDKAVKQLERIVDSKE